jgi:hypothetical protein
MKYKGHKCLTCAIYYDKTQFSIPCIGCPFKTDKEKYQIIETLKPIAPYLDSLSWYYFSLCSERGK